MKALAKSLVVMLGFFLISNLVFALSVEKILAGIEVSSGGRIGVYALNTANGRVLQYRSNERFPMGCTSKTN